MSALGDEWPVDSEGYPHREAARVVLFNEEDRLLLARGHDRDEPERSWWFTIGGGIMAGESPREAAVRELFEETGIRLEENELLGPVAYRSAEFDFLAVTARQDEWFFIARTRKSLVLVHDGWTELERDVIDEQRWWGLDEIDAEECEIYPRRLTEFARAWLKGWDGVVKRIIEVSAPSRSRREESAQDRDEATES